MLSVCFLTPPPPVEYSGVALAFLTYALSIFYCSEPLSKLSEVDFPVLLTD